MNLAKEIDSGLKTVIQKKDGSVFVQASLSRSAFDSIINHERAVALVQDHVDEIAFLEKLRDQYKQGSVWLDAFERSIKMVDERLGQLRQS